MNEILAEAPRLRLVQTHAFPPWYSIRRFNLHSRTWEAVGGSWSKDEAELLFSSYVRTMA